MKRAEAVKQYAQQDFHALITETGFRHHRGPVYFCADHEERTASCYLYLKDGRLKRFCRCDDSLDAIDLVERSHKVTTMQAIELLEQRYGISAPSAPEDERRNPMLTQSDRALAELIYTGLLWRIDHVLEELKRPFSEGGEVDFFSIRKWTQRQLALKKWSPYRRKQVLTRFRRRNDAVAWELVRGPMLQQSLVAQFVQAIALEGISA